MEIPSPSVEGNAVEQQTWSDPCESTTKDPNTASHGYSLISDQVIYNSGDGQMYREVIYSASSGFGGPDNVITGSHLLVRHWASSPAITGGEKEIPEDGTLTVLPGETVTLSVTPATDEDTWTMVGVGTGIDPDMVTYLWSSGDGSFPGDTSSRSVQWQAPQDVGTYTVTVTIDDAPAQVSSPDTGSRDDSQLSQSFTIKVAPKVWDTDLAIGNARQEDGTSIENGRMVLPQDQTGEYPVPEHVKVFAEQTIDLSVEAATDVDHWEMEDTDLEGYDNDTVTYSWSASSGQIVGGANQRNAKWKAPTEAGTYTLTCTIDDTPKAIGAQEEGSRDDSSITRTVEVEVLNGESSATLKLYKDGALTEEVDGDVGGTAYIVLEVTLGAGQHLVSTSATLRVEESYPQHSETSRRWDSSISFGSGWQKKDANGEWQVTSETPQSTNDTEDDEYFRKVWTWSTTTTPLGHNETHTIKLVNVDGGDDTELTFAPETGDGDTKGPSGISADVKNLVITDVSANPGTKDYIKFDPDASDNYAHPTISFEVEDKGDSESDGTPHKYQWYVRMYDTAESSGHISSSVLSATIMGEKSGTGTVTVTINDPTILANFGVTKPSQDQALVAWGTYGYDITVVEYDGINPIDSVGRIRSSLLTFPPQMPLPIVDEEGNPRLGHDIEGWGTGNEEYKYYASYYLDSDRDAQKVKIDFIGSDLSTLTSKNGSTSKETPHLDIPLYAPTSNDGEGIYIGVFIGEDDYAEQYRDHQPRRTLALNKRLYHPPASMVSPYASGPNAPFASAIASSFSPLLRMTGYAVKDHVGGMTTGLFMNIIKNSWVVNYFAHGDSDGGMIEAGNGVVAANYHEGHLSTTKFLSVLPDNALSNLRFIMYISCGSGKTSSVDGNIAGMTHMRGAKTTAGFTADIPLEPAPYFSRMLWLALVEGGNTTDPNPDPDGIKDAIEYAADQTNIKYGVMDDGGGTILDFHNYAIFPTGSQLKIAKVTSGGHLRPKN